MDRATSLIDPADLVCPRHLREAAEQGVSGVELALAVARLFNRMPQYRGDDPGWEAWLARYCCDRLSREDFGRAWRKAMQPPSMTDKEKKRRKVPTTPISEEAAQ